MAEGGKTEIPFPRYANILMHSECRTEIEHLIHKHEIPDFVAAYEQRIKFLSQNLGREAMIHRSWYEVLRNAQGLRSIHIVKFRNLRILYMIDNGKAFLLLAFEERQGHKNTEYTNYINPALERLHERAKML